MYVYLANYGLKRGYYVGFLIFHTNWSTRDNRGSVLLRNELCRATV